MYKNDLATYKRPSIKIQMHNKLLSYELLYRVSVYIASFFISRVILMKDIMPFGIAFFTAACFTMNPADAVLTGVIAAIGTLSSASVGYKCVSHSIVILAIICLSVFIKDSKQKKLKIVCAVSVLNIAVNLLIAKIFSKPDLVAYDYIFVILETFIIVGFVYIFSFGIPAYIETKKRKVFSKEEVTCICLSIALVLSGMWDIKIYKMSLTNMISFLIVLIAGYMEGAPIGAAVGVSFGLVAGITSPADIPYIGVYGLCGLISGLFKEAGKIMSAAGFLVSGVLISLYASQNLNIKNMYMDMLVPIIIFLIVPDKKYERIGNLIDSDKMAIKLQQSYIDRVQDTINRRMSGISTSLSGLSEALKKNTENELAKKTEINSMVESLADRACFSCECRNNCWEKELCITYNLFLELLKTMEKGGKVTSNTIPDGLKRKCIKPNELTRQANNIFEIFRLNNGWKSKIANSKMIVADEIEGISKIVNTMVSEVSTSVDFRNDIEEDIAADLDKSGVDFNDVLAVKNNRNKYEVIVYRKPCSGKQICSKDFVPVISKTLGVRMRRDDERCRFVKNSSSCQFRLVEAEKYDIITAISKLSKEDVSGDNCSFGSIGDGRYMIALSDGMGSGVRAAMESSTTISLLEKFIEAGFERETVIKAINSVLGLRSCEECYATVDMVIIDLYSGVGEFIKVGAATSFIKSGKIVETVKSTSLPVGILNEINIESDVINLKNGDMIITVSDGVVDSDIRKEKWIEDELSSYESNNPKEVADHILNKAKENYNAKIGDDMTVMASRIIKIL